MPEKYGTHETATLLVLLLENAEVPNPDLKNKHRIDLRPAGRAKLIKAGLLETHKGGNRLVHNITEAGIAWCATELTEVEPPTRSGPLVRLAFEALRRTVADLRRRGIPLVDALHPTGDGEPDEMVDLESLIRTAYEALSVKPQDWVRLAKLRPRLNGAEKNEVDQVLLAMTRTGLVHLAPDSDRKMLTDADRDAAIRIGKEDKHLVAIEES